MTKNTDIANILDKASTFAVSAAVGANVIANTTTIFVGNTTVNVVANSTAIKLANSTVNTTLVVPTNAQWTGSYFLHANGTWQQAGGLPGGSDTYVQFNDGGTALGGQAGFTFTKTTNNVVIANTLTVGTATVNSILAAVAALNVTNQTNTATLFVTTSANVGTAVLANSIGLTTTGFVNAVTVVNSASHTIGTTFIANTLGLYHTGLVNAASYNATGYVANTTGVYHTGLMNAASYNATGYVANTSGVYHTTVVNSALFTTTGFRANATHVVATSNSSGHFFGNTLSRLFITANSVNTSGGVYPDSNTLGQALGSTTQRWVLLANTIESTGLANVSALNVVAATNTATLFVTTSAAVGANVVANATTILVGNSTTNVIISNNIVDIGNTTINVVANLSVLKLANSTVIYTLVKPTAAQVTAADYYPASDSTWKQVAGGGTPGGSNTYIQYNDSNTFGGSAGFIFNETTNNVLIANTLTVGANVAANTSAIFIGNTTVNGTANSVFIGVANSTGTANLTPVDLKIGTSVVNSIALSAGANVVLSTSQLGIGSTTANLVANSIIVKVANSTGTANLQPTQLVIGTSVVNSTVIAAGANVMIDTADMLIGNTTANVFANSILVKVANSTATANLTPIALTVGTSVVNTTVHAAGANVFANVTSVRVGNSIINTVMGNNGLVIANSTVSHAITLPTAAQNTAGNYFLGANGTWQQVAATGGTASIGITIDGGGAPITTGVKGYVFVPFAATINEWTLLADVSGAIVIDVWKDTYANFPPVDADSITATFEPEIVASGTKAQDLDITNWSSTALAANNVLAFNVDSCTNITKAWLTLKVTKT